MAKLTRRNFLEVAGVAGALGALAACDTKPAEEPAGEGSAEPGTEPEPQTEPEPEGPATIIHDASEYPIDPDGDDVEALWASEETRDGWTRITADGAPELGVWDTAKIIQVDGLAFKDMNGNGKLDLWEDWRQPIDDRATALSEELSVEDGVKLMFHGGTEAIIIPGMASDEEATDEENPLLHKGSRAGVSRLNSSIESYASDIAWINDIEKWCEENDPHCIPYLNSTDQYQLFDIPNNASLASAMDKDLWRKAGMWIGRGWRATGVRCELGPQIDIYTQPLGCRLCGSVCEDPAVNRDFAAAFAGGLQSTWGDDEATDDLGWGKDSVFAMLKHYVGEGAPEGGRNDHYDGGKYNVFPGDNFDAHLIPFLDGGLNLDSKTGQMAAIMPCYGIAFSEDEEYGENVGAAYNGSLLGILRNADWDGMITTDWQVLDNQTFGVEDLSEPQRYEKMIMSGVDQAGGNFKPDVAMEAYELLKEDIGEDEALARIQKSVARIVRVMMTVDLFENPYTSAAAARELLENPAAAAFGIEASEKSTVMVKNAGAISADNAGSKKKVYLPQHLVDGVFSTGIDEEIAAENFEVITDTLGEPSLESTNFMTGLTEILYQESDCTRVSADELADVELAVVRIAAPGYNAYGAGMDNANNTSEYLPISMQYRPYTATEAREVSVAGDRLEDGTRENRSYRGKSATCTNESELDFVISIKESLPADAKLILIIDIKNPIVLEEVEPYADAILLGYTFSNDGPCSKALANIVCGVTEPSGLLSFQMPANMAAIETQLDDVPRDMDCYVDSEGNTYDFCFGLNWDGVIDDDRVATYKVAPLTEPETEVIWG